jgi:hypothetical protein
MGPAIYVMCLATSAFCAALLLRAYRRSRSRLLMWSGSCFVLLALNNLLLLVDVLVVPDVDLSYPRTATAVLGVAVLTYGLIADAS